MSKKVGQGLASAIETGESAAQSVKNAAGMSSGEAKQAVNEKATEAKETINQKTAEAKDTMSEKSQQAKEVWNDKSSDVKQKANETAEQTKQKANQVCPFSPLSLFSFLRLVDCSWRATSKGRLYQRSPQVNKFLA